VSVQAATLRQGVKVFFILDPAYFAATSANSSGLGSRLVSIPGPSALRVFFPRFAPLFLFGLLALGVCGVTTQVRPPLAGDS